MKLVLFDCDGTLVDSINVIHTCMERTFEDFGLERPALAHTKSIIGLTLDIAIAQMLDRSVDEEVSSMTARYKEHFMLHRQNGGALENTYDGIVPLIAELAAREDVLLGVVTGKSRRGLNAILEHHGMTRSFFTTRTADDCPSKPHPAMVLECCAETGITPDAAIVIGDAIYDMQMAASAGARGIGVAWGYAPVEALLAAGADRIVRRADEIAGLI
ncbi:MAG: HAD-IA family hydrolase [Hoeflea sp.]|uniref:HAD-IA family hydrolase n=1 Tax=Hoeflea sp. TaxID=1940281 RepID=UPI0032EF7A11